MLWEKRQLQTYSISTGRLSAIWESLHSQRAVIWLSKGWVCTSLLTDWEWMTNSRITEGAVERAEGGLHLRGSNQASEILRKGAGSLETFGKQRQTGRPCQHQWREGYFLSRSRSKTYNLELKDRGTNTVLREEVEQETKEPHFYPSCKGNHHIWLLHEGCKSTEHKQPMW